MSNGNPIEITVTGGGDQIAIQGNGYGVDELYGDVATGVAGFSDVGFGVNGTSGTGIGVLASTQSGLGIQANSDAGTAIGAISQQGVAIAASTSGDSDAIQASTGSIPHAAVSATNTADARPSSSGQSQGYAVWAYSNNTAIYGQGNPAGYFDGDVHVTGLHHCDGDIHVKGDMYLINSSSADIAEDFDLEDDPANAEPGTVLVIHPSGKLSACTEPYDTRVAGVVSGAGDLRAAIVLQRLQERPDRSPLALVGKALCKVDAAFGSITAGDLLTTSATPGHAMKVTDRTGAVGAILGKALHPLDTGRGLVPILVSLR